MNSKKQKTFIKSDNPF